MVANSDGTVVPNEQINAYMAALAIKGISLLDEIGVPPSWAGEYRQNQQQGYCEPSHGV